MTDDYYSEQPYKGQLDAESLLIMHMNRTSIYRDTDIKRYCSAVETLILITPKQIREASMKKLRDIGLQRGRYSTITEEKLIVYDDLLIYINEELEKHNMIWKMKSVKTFE